MATTFRVGSLVLGLLLLNSCSINRMAVNRAADMFSEASVSFNEEADWAFARDAMPANLKMMEGMLKVSPDNKTFQSMLAQGYCSYAFGFLEDSGSPADIERAKGLYMRGYSFGMAALPEKVRTFAQGNLEEFQKAVSSLEGDDVARLFWAAYCLGGWVNLNKADIGAVADLSRAEVMMHRVLDANENFYYGGAHLFYGVYYGARPKMLGGDPKKAKDHFDRASRISQGKLLMSKLYLAQFYAVPTQDEELFEKTLKEVLDAPVDLLPAERLANQIAKRRATKLLASKKDLF
ncbi:TRAP transporter TatT component family protein [Bdellovibrionota bacterium FG-2]